MATEFALSTRWNAYRHDEGEERPNGVGRHRKNGCCRQGSLHVGLNKGDGGGTGAEARVDIIGDGLHTDETGGAGPQLEQ